MTHEPGGRSEEERAEPLGPAAGPSWPPPPAGPVGVPPSGQHPVPWGPPPPHQNPYAAGAHSAPFGYGPTMRHPDARPGTVLAAGITALVTTGIVLLVLLLLLLALLVAREQFLEEVTDQAVSSDDARTGFVIAVVVLGVLVVWCLVAVWMAVLALRRSKVGRVGLTVSAGLTALVSLAAIGGGASVFTLAAAIVVIVCLYTGGAGDWFHREHLFSPPRMPRL